MEIIRCGDCRIFPVTVEGEYCDRCVEAILAYLAKDEEKRLRELEIAAQQWTERRLYDCYR